MKNIFKVTILCTSDVHGFYMPWDYSEDKYSKNGGLTRVSTLYKKLKEKNEHTFIIDNGDLIQGNNAEFFINNTKSPAIEVVNKIGYSVYNMGNHEFNFGMKKLKSITDQFNGTVTMSNIYKSDGVTRLFNAFHIIEVGSIKIAILSLNTPLVREFESKRQNLKDYIITDADIELKKILNELKDYDCIIGLFHLGLENENNIKNTGIYDLLRDKEINSKLDLVFAGHMHKLEKEKFNNTFILEPGVHAEAVSRVDLTFDVNNDKKLVDIDPSIEIIDESIESDEEIENILRPYHNKLREYINEELGYTDLDFGVKDEVRGIPQIYVSQTNLSEFIINVMLHYSKADVVALHFDNPYPLTIDKVIKRKHIHSAYAYSGGEISNFIFTGRQLKKYMEWSASFFNQQSNEDVTISFKSERTKFKYSTFDIFGNLKYEIDITQKDGERIRNLSFLNEDPLEDDNTYIVGMNKYRLDFLVSENGPLSNENIEMIYTTISDKSLIVKGTIRNLCELYLSELDNKTYNKKSELRWKLVQNSLYSNIKKLAIKLINDEDINLFTPDINKSINLNYKLDKYQFERLRKKYTISENCSTLIDVINDLRRKNEI